MKFAAEYPLTPRTLPSNVTLSATALVGMLCVAGSGVCASAEPAPASTNAPAVRQAPVSAFARRVVRFLPYNRSPFSCTLGQPRCGLKPSRREILQAYVDRN